MAASSGATASRRRTAATILLSRRTMIAVYLISVAAILLIGRTYYDGQRTSLLAQRSAELTSIRDLRSSQIAQWRGALLDDGRVASLDPSTLSGVDAWLASRVDGAAWDHLRAWMTALVSVRGYSAAKLISPDGSRWISVGTSATPTAAELSEAHGAVASGAVSLSDLYVDGARAAPRIDVVAPLTGGGASVRAVLLLQDDPSRYIYPLIKTWPVPSASAETLLLRPERGAIVFLNDLRFRSDSALRFSVPATDTLVLGVQAVSGGARIVEGVDYRHVASIGAVAPVPDSGWFIVAKMDTAEAYAPIDAVFGSTILACGLLILLLGAGFVIVWRQNKAMFLEERLEAERVGQERLNMAVQGAPLPIMIHAEDGEVIQLNRAWQEISGYTPADIPTTADWTEKAYGVEAGTVRADIEALYGLSDRVDEGEYAIRAADGRELVWDFSSAPLGRLSDGRRIVMSTARDVTDRKRADLERDEAAARLRALLDNAPYGAHMYELTPDDRLVFVGYNQRAVQMLELDHEQFLGMTLEEAFPGNVGTDTPDNYRRIAREGGTWQTEQYAYNDDQGVAGVFEVYAFSFGPRRVAVFFRDVTDIKKAEIELQKRSEELERSNAELEKFAYVASHDLQEPLRMVASYTQLLQQRYAGRLDSDADEFIAYAVDGATRMRTLINDLLAYSRVGTQGAPMADTDLEVVFADVMADLQGALEDAGATVTHDPLPHIRADASQIGRVFLNLISNAAKFRSEEPPAIHVGVRREGADWLFSVQDNGIGIDPQYFDRIFVIFQRLESRAKYPGTGIGLAICKRIINRHGGRMWVESKPGAGSTFLFTLHAGEEVSHG